MAPNCSSENPQSRRKSRYEEYYIKVVLFEGEKNHLNKMWGEFLLSLFFFVCSFVFEKERSSTLQVGLTFRMISNEFPLQPTGCVTLSTLSTDSFQAERRARLRLSLQFPRQTIPMFRWAFVNQ